MKCWISRATAARNAADVPERSRSSRRKAFGLLPINSIKVDTEVRITLPPLAMRWRAWRIN